MRLFTTSVGVSKKCCLVKKKNVTQNKEQIIIAQIVNISSVFFVLEIIMAHLEMWWLNGSAPDFGGRGPRFVSGISHNDPADALQDHCEIK